MANVRPMELTFVMKTRTKTLSYRRAGLSNPYLSLNLEDSIWNAASAFPSTADRTFEHDEGEIQGQAIERRHAGVCLHLSYYLPDQHASVVPVPSAESANETGTSAPPAGHNYVRGEVFALIRSNHVVICACGARDSIVTTFIRRLLEKNGMKDLADGIAIHSVANADKVKTLQTEGVKRIQFNASMFEATARYQERHTIQRTLIKTAVREFYAIFGANDFPDIGDEASLENLSVRIEISFDGRKKGGEIAQERLSQVAGKVLDENEDSGFTIVTGNDKKLTAEGLRVHRKVNLAAHGHSVSKVDVWRALADYIAELRTSGALEQ